MPGLCAEALAVVHGSVVKYVSDKSLVCIHHDQLPSLFRQKKSEFSWSPRASTTIWSCPCPCPCERDHVWRTRLSAVITLDLVRISLPLHWQSTPTQVPNPTVSSADPAPHHVRRQGTRARTPAAPTDQLKRQDRWTSAARRECETDRVSFVTQ